MTTAEPITAPGIYRDLSRADYDRIPAVTQSVLKRFRRTPAHAKEAIDNPTEPTDAQRLGTLVHAYLLEPDRFASRYVVLPDLTEGIVDKNGQPYRVPKLTGEYKARKARFAQENVGKLFIEPEEKAVCDGIGEAIAGHSTAARLLDQGILPDWSEVAVVWTDEDTGLLCKGLFDRWSFFNGESVIVDVKTTEDASPSAFARDALKLGHHLQTAFYLTGAHRVGKPAHRFLHIVCEKDPPYAVAVYELDEASIDQGIREVADYLRQYRDCCASGRWPAFPDEIQTVRLPRYGFTDEGT